MSEKPEYPPAFPQSQEIWGGMTLRDYFAGQALAGLTGNTGRNLWASEDHAKTAFKYADAMLKARSQ
jgi:hypothetical protein